MLFPVHYNNTIATHVSFELYLCKFTVLQFMEHIGAQLSNDKENFGTLLKCVTGYLKNILGKSLFSSLFNSK